MKLFIALFLITLAEDSVKIKISETKCFSIKNFGAYNKMVTVKCDDNVAKIELDEKQNLLHSGSCIKIASNGEIINISCNNDKRFIYKNGFVYRQFKSETGNFVQCLQNRNGIVKLRRCNMKSGLYFDDGYLEKLIICENRNEQLAEQYETEMENFNATLNQCEIKIENVVKGTW